MKNLILIVLTVLQTGLANAQLANPDFETWAADPINPNLQYPSGWQATDAAFCWQVADAYSGASALKLSVWYFYVSSKAIQQAPVNDRPGGLNGFYKYTHNVGAIQRGAGNVLTDTAFVTVYLTRWNPALSQRDTIGTGRITLDSSTVYKPFTCPVSYVSSATPDSIKVIIAPSIVRPGMTAVPVLNGVPTQGYCSFLTVDHLSLGQSATGIPETGIASSFDMFPNPTPGLVHLAFKQPGHYAVKVTDLTGRELIAVTATSPVLSLNADFLPPGVYLVKVSDPYTQGHHTQKLVRN